ILASNSTRGSSCKTAPLFCCSASCSCSGGKWRRCTGTGSGRTSAGSWAPPKSRSADEQESRRTRRDPAHRFARVGLSICFSVSPFLPLPCSAQGWSSRADSGRPDLADSRGAGIDRGSLAAVVALAPDDGRTFAHAGEPWHEQHLAAVALVQEPLHEQ